MTLEVTDVSVQFGETLALDRLSLAIDEGEVVAVLGPSGCGKSTLLRVIAGIEQPSTGRIAWNGDDLASVPVHKRDVGLMFQDHALFGHLSVAENIGFGLRMRNETAATIQSRCDELLHLVGLPTFADRHIDSLSGGEAQRVALARALAPGPRLLLLDEPLGALDRSRREQLVTDLRQVLRSVGQTTLHVTHDQDEAFAIADRVAVMAAGSIEQIGTPTDIWHRPANAFVATFIGHQVTMIDGRQFALPPDAAVVDNDAADATPMEVIDRVFRDGSWRLTVRGNEGLGRGLQYNVESADNAPLGSLVPVRFRPDRLIPFAAD